MRAVHGCIRANRNDVTWLNSGIPGLESIRPTNCHQFPDADGCQAAKTHARICAVYENAHVSKATVVEWHPRFRSRQQGTSNEAWPGQAHVVTTPENVTKVEEAVPPHSPDLCEFHVLSTSKETLKGHRFRSDEDVKATVVQWFQQQPRQHTLWSRSIELMHQWDACLSAHGDYF
jgi:hypothetical protein